MHTDTTQIQPGWLNGRAALRRYCGLSGRTISRLVSEGKLPHRRMGQKTLLFRIADVDRALQSLGN